MQMSAITYDKIKIDSPWKIQTIYELSIKKTMNNHAELRLSALVNESDASKIGLQETIDAQIKVYTEDGENKSWLFKGRLKDVNVSIKSDVYILTARFLSETVVLDREQKSRSFQDTNLTYSDVAARIMEDYPGKSFELTAKKVTIDGPLIQYKETDWQFIKRLASLQEDVLVPDVILDEVVFSFGYPSGGAKTLPEDISYASGKDIASFNTDVESEYKPGLICNEYAYYEVVTYDELTIGDQITFHGYKLYVGAVTIELKDGILVYRCKLVRYMTLRQNPILNEKFQGVSLEGKVLSVQNQEIKLHLDIDAEQDEDTAYWYPFVPPTTDMLYLMPQIGTNASLYIPRLKEQNAIITGCVRTNGESCEKTGDPSTRYLATEYGQEMRLAPGGIYFTAGRNDLILTFDDEEGVKISSHKEIVIEAKEEIIFDSKTKVMINSPNQIKMTTPYGGLSMENEIHFANMKTIIECTDETELPLVEQKLMQKQSNVFNKPQTKEDTGIEWGGIINAVLGVRVAEASPLEQGDVISSAPDDGTDEANKNQPGKDENGRTYQERVLEKANSPDATTWDKVNGFLWSSQDEESSSTQFNEVSRYSIGAIGITSGGAALDDKSKINFTVNGFIDFLLQEIKVPFVTDKGQVNNLKVIEANKDAVLDNFNKGIDDGDKYKTYKFIRDMQDIYKTFAGQRNIEKDKEKLIKSWNKRLDELPSDVSGDTTKNK
jgi:hypothetical protein